MPKTKDGRRKSAGEKRVFLNMEIDERLRTDLRIAALSEGMNLKDWLPVVLRKVLDRPSVAARS